MQGTSLHLAILMDGNRRWATRRRLPPAPGHRARPRPGRRHLQAAPRLLPAGAVRGRRPPLRRPLRAGFRPRRSRRGDRRIPQATAPLRRAARDCGGMNAMSEKTRLGLEILGAATVLGVSGDLLLRATPWGLNALLCAAGLVAAGGNIVNRHRFAVYADALCPADDILLLCSNYIPRAWMA